MTEPWNHPRGPAALYEQTALAITAETGFPQVEEDLQGGDVDHVQMVPIYFWLEPRRMDAGGSRQKPGGEAQVTERIAVWVHHELLEEASRATYAQVSADALRVIGAVLARKELSGLFQPRWLSTVFHRSPTRIRSEIEFAITYDFQIPASSGQGPSNG